MVAVIAMDIPGHLQPLGSHAPPERDLAVHEGFPTPLDFFDKYLSTSTPVLFRGAAKELESYTRWTDEYMSAKHGKEIVEVEEGKKEDRDLGMWNEPFADFLRKYQGKDEKDRHKGNFYSVSAIPRGMKAEYEMPKAVNCPAFFDNSAGGMRQINHWFSSGGTSSVLHKDSFENINCLYDGSKDMVFIPPNYTTEELHWDYRDNHGHSYIDCQKVDMVRYPNFRNVKWWKAHMDRGDCLYIPVGWYHHVKSNPGENKRNFAINLWWNMRPDKATRNAVASCKDQKTTFASDIKFKQEQVPGEPDPEPDMRDDDDENKSNDEL